MSKKVAKEKTFKRKSVAKAPTKPLYHASIRVLGKTYEATGQTAREAVENLSVPKAAGVGILIVSSNDASNERILTSVTVARLFSPSKLMREIALKNVLSLIPV